MVKLLPIKHEKNKGAARPEHRWAEMATASAINCGCVERNDNTLWHRGKHVVAQSQDRCQTGTWVFAKSPFSVSETILKFVDDTENSISS